MARGSRIRHLISGGQFFVQPQRRTSKEDGSDSDAAPWNRLQQSLDTGELVEMKAVGPAVQQLLTINSFGSRLLGLKNDDGTLIHSASMAGPIYGKSSAPARFRETIHAENGVSPAGVNASVAPSRRVQTPKTITLQDSSCCSVSQWVTWDERVDDVLYRRTGKVAEFLQISGTPAEGDNCVNAVLVQRALCGETHAVYQMPRMELIPEYVSLNPRTIIAIINVQHNCADNHCPIERTGTQVVEGEKVKERRLRVTHKSRPNDMILNTGQMRSAAVLDPFRRTMSKTRSRSAIIFDAAREAADQKKRARRQQDAAAEHPGPAASLATTAPTLSTPHYTYTYRPAVPSSRAATSWTLPDETLLASFSSSAGTSSYRRAAFDPQPPTQSTYLHSSPSHPPPLGYPTSSTSSQYSLYPPSHSTYTPSERP